MASSTYLKIFAVLAVLFLAADCQLFHNLMRSHPYQIPYSGSYIHSMASQVPGSHQNTIDGYQVQNTQGSNLPAPQPPKVLQDIFNNAGPPPQAAPAPSPMDTLMNMFGGMSQQGNSVGGSGATDPYGGTGHGGAAGGGSHGGSGGGFSMPLTPNVKNMVNRMATQMGHKAYYEAHGCVDPTTALHGRSGQMASMAFMMGCNNHQASHVCELAQVSHGGAQNAKMRMMMEFMLPKHMKDMFEQCLTPSTLMNGMMGSFGAMTGGHQQHGGLTPPPGAAQGQTKADCSSMSQMMMMNPGAMAEGLMSPEAMEQIGSLRNRYFKMTCQENLIMGSLPYRLCCPGHVKPPTLQEAMMMKSMAGGA